ncbi:CorA family divalent cation transporter [Methylocystis parvus]|uniref:CorA family divalent cation transporter n=1 Tax=Methylocystis parvus TaxID=134 RepID=UPI003C7165D9
MTPSPLTGPFLWTLTFDGSRLASAQAGEEPRFGGGRVVWAHIDADDARGRAWIESLRQIPAEARDLLTSPSSAQRLYASGDALWGALVDYAQDFGQDIDQDAPSAQDLTQLRFAAGPGYLVTTRRRPSRSAAAARRAVMEGKRFATSFDIVDAIVDRSFAAMDEAIEQLAEDLNDVEDRVLDDETRDERQRLGVLRRALIRVHREINGAMRMVSRFEPVGQISPEAQAVVQRLSLRLDGCNQEVQSTEQRARLLQDEIVSKLTTDTNRQLYILTILSTLLLPPTLISGIFGMNVKGVPFADEPGRGFVYALAVCGVSALSAWVLLWVLDRRQPPRVEPTPRRRKRKTQPAPAEEG